VNGFAASVQKTTNKCANVDNPHCKLLDLAGIVGWYG